MARICAGTLAAMPGRGGDTTSWRGFATGHGDARSGPSYLCTRSPSLSAAGKADTYAANYLVAPVTHTPGWYGCESGAAAVRLVAALQATSWSNLRSCRVASTASRSASGASTSQ